MGNLTDLTGMQFGSWEVLEHVGKGKYKCRCTCPAHTEKIINGYDLKNGKATRCSVCRKKYNVNIGDNFKGWVVTKVISSGVYELTAPDGEKIKKSGYELFNRPLKEVGSTYNKFQDLTGKRFGSWEVLSYAGESMWNCRCNCGTIQKVHRYSLTSGMSTSCGCSRKSNLIGNTFGELTVTKSLGGRLYECKCSCGNIIEVAGGNLQNGNIRSCGCKTRELFRKTMMQRYGDISTLRVNNPRENWQIETLEDKDKLEELLKYYIKVNNTKPTITEIANILYCNRQTVTNKIEQYELIEYIIDSEGKSDAELEMAKFIKSIAAKNGFTVTQGDRKILKGQEIDIYIPEIHLGIEYNGSYWHSDLFKEKKYHYNKSLEAAKNGVRLIHIFDYEYITNKNKIEYYLSDIINQKKQVINARDCKVAEINKDDAKEFLDKYHLQGFVSSGIYLGLHYNSELVAVMTFGVPRFNYEYISELLRLAVKYNVIINGGIEKLFKYYVTKYNPMSIVSYCDISKFLGSIYKRLGFENCGTSEPNYRWVNTYTMDVLSRYQTQKHRLLNLGYGSTEQTEDEIMHNRHYNKVYDCGNVKYVWKQVK